MTVSPRLGSVAFDVDQNHHDAHVTMKFSLVRTVAATSGDGAAMGASGGPGSIPLGRDKQDCVSVFVAVGETAILLPPLHL